MNELIQNIDKIHTTELGIIRIKKNLKIESDVNDYCKKIILNKESIINIKGKNYYVSFNNIIITINKNSYTIITAHQKRRLL